jgi:hypothetical protein
MSVIVRIVIIHEAGTKVMEHFLQFVFICSTAGKTSEIVWVCYDTRGMAVAAKQIVASKQITVVLLFARFFIIVSYFFCNRNV